MITISVDIDCISHTKWTEGHLAMYNGIRTIIYYNMQLMIFKNLLERCTDYVLTSQKNTFRQVNTNRNVQIFQKLNSR